MPVRAKLVFKEHIPFRLEHELVNERGFHVVYRMNGGGVCLQKGYESEDEELEVLYRDNDDIPWDKDLDDDNYVIGGSIYHPIDHDPPPEDWWDIPKPRVAEIEKRCQRLYDSFMDPYRQTDEIKDQLKEMCVKSKFTAAESELVENWIYCNVL